MYIPYPVVHGSVCRDVAEDRRRNPNPNPEDDDRGGPTIFDRRGSGQTAPLPG